MPKKIKTEVRVNRLIGVLAGIAVVSTAIADENDFRCLKSVGLKKPIRLQFVFKTEQNDIGFVKYENGSGLIEVKRIREKETMRVPGGRPSEFETTWREVIPNGTGGTYVVVSQGALINGFRYIRQDGKKFKFEVDFEVTSRDGCEWSVR